MELGRRSERRRGASPIGFGLALVAALALPLVAVQAWSAILVLLSIAGYMFALNVIFARLTAVHEPDHNATRTLLPIEKRLIRHTIVAFSITAGVVILGVVRLIGVGVVLFVALMASLLVGASAADTARHQLELGGLGAGPPRPGPASRRVVRWLLVASVVALTGVAVVFWLIPVAAWARVATVILILLALSNLVTLRRRPRGSSDGR